MTVVIGGLADDVSLQVAASAEEMAQEDLCSFAKAVSDDIRHWVESGQPIARLQFAPNSFGTVDACATAPEEDVALALGAPAESRIPPAGHWCLWGRFDVREPSAIVEFNLGEEQRATAGSTAEVIAGRTSLVSVDEPGTCLVRTQHIEADHIVPNTVEIASVSVKDVSAKNACTAARELASVVWKTLPTG